MLELLVELLGISFTNDDALIVSLTTDSYVRVYDLEFDEEVTSFRPLHTSNRE